MQEINNSYSYSFFMGFWHNVDVYIDFKNIQRKELAFAIGMKSQTLDRAIERDSEPKFVVGVKVCKYLKVNYDFFLDSPIVLNSERTDDKKDDTQQQLNLYRKYHDLIHYCENIPTDLQTSVKGFVKNLAENTPDYKAD